MSKIAGLLSFLNHILRGDYSFFYTYIKIIFFGFIFLMIFAGFSALWKKIKKRKDSRNKS